MSTRPGETYLYDGVYVSFDGFQFCLRAPRERGDHFVYLEPHAIKLFLEFVEQQKKHSARPSVTFLKGRLAAGSC